MVEEDFIFLSKEITGYCIAYICWLSRLPDKFPAILMNFIFQLNK